MRGCGVADATVSAARSRGETDERFEQPAVVELLGVPLDAEHRPAVGSLERFRRPVVGAADDPKPWRHPVDGLMVMARRRHVGAQRAADPAVGVERDGARAEDPSALRRAAKPLQSQANAGSDRHRARR